MNLFFNPSVSELHELISNSKNNRAVHDVVIDYDGEVLIDPQLQQPNLDLNKFKFHLQLSELSKRAITAGSNHIRQLFTNLLAAWNTNDYTGAMFA